jgi:DNA polymerase I-like protein with 3'-5' exonuclease and polymerase domains
MRTPKPATVDFETLPIEDRPLYPPEPTGVSIILPGGKPTYYAWGHPTENNCTKEQGKRALRDAWRSPDGILCHNGKFDYDIGMTRMGMPALPWHKIHDTMFLAYLVDPHARQIGVKELAERFLGIKPAVRDEVREWIHANRGTVAQMARGYIERTGKNITPKRNGDFIGYAPGKLVGRYANDDTNDAIKLFRKLYPMVVSADMLQAYERERELMPILLENERKGMRVDVLRLQRDVVRYNQARERVADWLRKKLKSPGLNFDSPAEVVEALDRNRIVTQWGVTATGKRSTAKATMTIDVFRNVQVFQALRYHGQVGTCLDMFMEPWLRIALANGGYISTNWHQTRGAGESGGTRTGRPSTSKPNFLNIPKGWDDKDDGYEHPTFIRGLPLLPLVRCYILPDNSKELFGHRDFNQQEFRLAAHFEDGPLMRAYNENPTLDTHDWARDEIERIMGLKFHRRPVKIINFGMLYGQGVPSLAAKLGQPVEEVKRLRAAQRRIMAGIIELDKGIKEDAKQGEGIRTLGGRVYYCEPPSVIRGRTQTWEYKLLNYLMQGSAADFTKQAVINYHNHPERDGRFLVTVYDEINASMPKRTWKHEMAVLNGCMVNALPLDVPMLTDGKIGPSWGELEKCK